MHRNGICKLCMMPMNEEEICGDREGEERKPMKEGPLFKNQVDEDLENGSEM